MVIKIGNKNYAITRYEANITHRSTRLKNGNISADLVTELRDKFTNKALAVSKDGGSDRDDYMRISMYMNREYRNYMKELVQYLKYDNA
jgi:hypothetical protein